LDGSGQQAGGFSQFFRQHLSRPENVAAFLEHRRDDGQTADGF